MKRTCRLAITVVALLSAGPSLAGAAAYSQLGLPVQPAGWHVGEPLAQRTIEREWGPSEDSTYHEVDVPGWKSEGFALAASGLLPGAGHLYQGEAGGWAYLLAEALGWVGHWYEGREAKDQWERLARFVGDPNDTSSAFAFARYTQRTGQDPAPLRLLWEGDRNAYYRALHDEPAWSAGFGGADPQALQSRVYNLVDAHDASLSRQRLYDTGLFFNHIIAAVDAWRAARAHNLPLREEYKLQLGTRKRGGEREWRAALVRRF